jgi:Zn-dependent alcohol dehydrogenase
LGTALMKQLIQTAKSAGVKQVYSIDLNDNTAMHVLAKELGMSATSDPDDPHQTIYSLTL